MEETEKMGPLRDELQQMDSRLAALEQRAKRLEREIKLQENMADKYKKQALIWEALYFGLMEEKLNQETKKQE